MFLLHVRYLYLKRLFPKLSTNKYTFYLMEDMSNQTSDNNKRIAKNTLLLYFRMLFMMVVSPCTRAGSYRMRWVWRRLRNILGVVVAMHSVIDSIKK